MEVTFNVMNVVRPILSVSKLVARSYLVVFGHPPYIAREGRRCALVRIAGLYYLPVKFRQPVHGDHVWDFGCDMKYEEAQHKTSLMVMEPVPWSLVCITPGTYVDLVRAFRLRAWSVLELKTQDALGSAEACQRLVCDTIEQ